MMMSTGAARRMEGRKSFLSIGRSRDFVVAQRHQNGLGNREENRIVVNDEKCMGRTLINSRSAIRVNVQRACPQILNVHYAF